MTDGGARSPAGAAEAAPYEMTGGLIVKLAAIAFASLLLYPAAAHTQDITDAQSSATTAQTRAAQADSLSNYNQQTNAAN